jgi:hypothetical protein
VVQPQLFRYNLLMSAKKKGPAGRKALPDGMANKELLTVKCSTRVLGLLDLLVAARRAELQAEGVTMTRGAVVRWLVEAEAARRGLEVSHG